MSRARDVMIHSAVTIMDKANGVKLIGEKEVEVIQLAAEWKANKTPVPEKYIRKAFSEMCEHSIQHMRRAGLVR